MCAVRADAARTQAQRGAVRLAAACRSRLRQAGREAPAGGVGSGSVAVEPHGGAADVADLGIDVLGCGSSACGVRQRRPAGPSVRAGASARTAVAVGLAVAGVGPRRRRRRPEPSAGSSGSVDSPGSGRRPGSVASSGRWLARAGALLGGRRLAVGRRLGALLAGASVGPRPVPPRRPAGSSAVRLGGRVGSPRLRRSWSRRACRPHLPRTLRPAKKSVTNARLDARRRLRLRMRLACE